MNNQNPKKIIMNLAENEPLMRYKSDEDFKSWQAKARKKLTELLGLDLIPCCDNEIAIKFEKDCGDYTDTYFTFQSEPDYYVPCHILKPKCYSGKLPLLLCLQGHSTGMHISIGEAKFDGDDDDINSGDRDYARIGVRKGYCTIAIEQRYMGECGGTEKGTGCQHRPENGINAMPALLFGRTAIGERVHDVIKAIDIITSGNYRLFDCVDINDITLTGNSGGGTTTFYTSCIDERIKVSAPSCCVCTYKDSIIDISHCGCNYIPGIARYFDMSDLAGLIVPRPLIIIAGKDDRIFPIEGVKKTYEAAKALYAAGKCKKNIQLIIGNGGHRYYAEEAFSQIEKMREI